MTILLVAVFMIYFVIFFYIYINIILSTFYVVSFNVFTGYYSLRELKAGKKLLLSHTHQLMTATIFSLKKENAKQLFWHQISLSQSRQTRTILFHLFITKAIVEGEAALQ